MQYKDFFKEYWRLLLIALIAIINAVLAFSPLISDLITRFFSISLLTLILSICYVVIDLYQRIKENNESKEVTVAPPQWNDITEIKESVKEIGIKMKEERVVVETRKEENRLVADLINENFISIETLEENVYNRKFVTVFCYQRGFKYQISDTVRGLIEKGKIDSIKRKYSKIFEEVGFIQLGYPYPFYIIPEENLYPKKLRNLNNIANFLLKKAGLALIEEWEEIKKVHEKNDPARYQKIKDKRNPLNFNMLIMKINRKDMRHKYKLKNDFNKAFVSELTTIVTLEKIKIHEDERIKINNLVFASSIKILVLSIDRKDREKIINLEKVFTKPEEEGGLGIKKFFDYHKKGKDKIKQILKTKIKDVDKVNAYADLIIRNSKEYETDLDKLGIQF